MTLIFKKFNPGLNCCPCECGDVYTRLTGFPTTVGAIPTSEPIGGCSSTLSSSCVGNVAGPNRSSFGLYENEAGQGVNWLWEQKIFCSPVGNTEFCQKLRYLYSSSAQLFSFENIAYDRGEREHARPNPGRGGATVEQKCSLWDFYLFKFTSWSVIQEGISGSPLVRMDSASQTELVGYHHSRCRQTSPYWGEMSEETMGPSVVTISDTGMYQGGVITGFSLSSFTHPITVQSYTWDWGYTSGLHPTIQGIYPDC